MRLPVLILLFIAATTLGESIAVSSLILLEDLRGEGLFCLFAELHACMRRHAGSLLAGVLTYGFRKTGGRFSRKALTPSRDSFVS